MDNEPPAHIYLRPMKWETRNFLGVALQTIFVIASCILAIMHFCESIDSGEETAHKGRQR